MIRTCHIQAFTDIRTQLIKGIDTNRLLYPDCTIELYLDNRQYYDYHDEKLTGCWVLGYSALNYDAATRSLIRSLKHTSVTFEISISCPSCAQTARDLVWCATSISRPGSNWVKLNQDDLAAYLKLLEVAGVMRGRGAGRVGVE